MKNYRLKEEHPDHFVIHDTKDKTDFKVAKAHIDLPMMVKLAGIQKFEGGGDVLADNELTNGFPIENQGQIGSMAQNLYDPSLDVGNGPMVAPPPIPDRPAPLPSSDSFSAMGNVIANNPTSLDQPPMEAPSQAYASSPTAMDTYQQNNQQYGNNMMKALGQEQGANNQMAQAQSQNAKDQQDIYAQQAEAMKQANDTYQQSINKNMAENDAIANDIHNTKIDPQQFWSNASTAGKIGMLAGIIISGAGAGANQGNMAMNVINKNIDQDIDAQKANLGTKKSLLSNNLEKFGQLNTAMAATRLNLLSVTQGQINAAAAKANSPMALAAAQKANAPLDQQKAALMQQIGVQQTGFQMMNSAAPPDGSVGYGKLWGLRATGAITPADEKALTEEIGNYDKMQKDTQLVMQNMQDIADLQNPNSRFADPIDSARKIEEKTNLVSDILAKDAFGRYNTDIAKHWQNAMPKLTSPALANEQMKSAIDTLQRNYTYPVNSRYQIFNPQANTKIMPRNQRQEILQSQFRPASPNQVPMVANRPGNN